MKRCISVFVNMILVLFLVACGSDNNRIDNARPDSVGSSQEECSETVTEKLAETEEGLEEVDLASVEKLCNIRITMDDMVLSGFLYDIETSRAFAEMLPLTVKLWNPAPGFARAFGLPERIPRYEKSGYEYELGSLAYWYEGPSVALIYQASREKTVVPVVPIGKITSDVSVFGEDDATITIELDESE